jgi:electron transfer flavoprotein alpha subunit
MNREQDVVVLLEISGEQRQEINEGLLSEGNRLAKGLGGSLSGLALDSLIESPHILETYGASTLYLLKGGLLSGYRCEVYASAIAGFFKTALPRLFLLAHSDMGRELAPRVAAHLNATAVTDCVDIIVEKKRLSYIKPLYGDQFEREISFAPGLLEIATIRPEVLNKKGASQTIPLQIKEIPIELSPATALTEPLGLTPPDFRTMDVVHARRILGAGAGTAAEEILPMVQELADLLEGSLATTRPMVDDGLFSRERMVGQTGKQVAPDLYFALGISGSPHHVSGIQESQRIISVNKDPGAPILQFSDTGFVGDLKKILPKLVERIRAWRGAS